MNNVTYKIQIEMKGNAMPALVNSFSSHDLNPAFYLFFSRPKSHSSRVPSRNRSVGSKG
jgi:hypothetical protein